MNNNPIDRPTPDEYRRLRSELLAACERLDFQHDADPLTERERIANGILMRAKCDELRSGAEQPRAFSPAQPFAQARAHIRQSPLFRMLRRMPKGAILHVHDTAMASVEFLVDDVTYRDHLWHATDSQGNIREFRFASKQPEETGAGKSVCWTRTNDERKRRGAAQFDDALVELFTLPRTDQHNDCNSIWTHFMGLFELVAPLITYAPVWGDYYREALRQALEDGVQYVEFRGVLPELYDLHGTAYTKRDAVQMYVQVLREFCAENPDFIGSRFIFAPLKTEASLADCVREMVALNEEFPDFVVGFDLVGQEDRAPMLREYANRLLQMPASIRFFFHAGETNWYGSIDENLIDAILLGTRRIGHGFALAKHPELLRLVKERDIAVEVNPLSNQQLGLVADLRNHPAATLFARNVPLVVSSDDPCFWRATPLSDDFYVTFVGVCSEHADLRTLRKLCRNSLRYSALRDDEKSEALEKWQRRWTAFVEELIAEHTETAPQTSRDNA